MRYFLLLLAVLCLWWIIVWADDAPTDTMVAKYVIIFIREGVYKVDEKESGFKQTAIVVPPKAKPGDTLLVANVLEGDRGIFLQKQYDIDMARQELRDLEQILKQLDSAYSDTGKKKP